jgi:L-iditol 2-dehydrogenase
MIAAILTGPDRWTVDEVPAAALAAGQVLIRTEVAAICGSDLHAAAHPDAVPSAPGAPGHEAVGTVTESRSSRFAPGDRVLCVPAAALSQCFASHQVLPDTALVPLPARGDAEDLVVAQQLGTAIFAMKRFWPAGIAATGLTAAVLGTGPAGLAFVSLLHRTGFAQVVASEVSPARLAAAAALGADTVVDAHVDDVVDVVNDRTGGRGADLVIEAAGRDSTRHQAMRMVRLDGRIGLFGLEEKPGLSTYPLAEMFRRRPTVEMTWGAQSEPGLASFLAATGLVTGGTSGLSGLVTHRLPLPRIAEAFALARDPGSGAVKVALTF